MSCIDGSLLMAITAVNIVAGVAVTLCAIVVLIVLFLLKKYYFHNQRLVMYLNVCVIIQGIVSAVNVHNVFEESTFCLVCGILHNYAIYIQHLMIWWITIDLFLLAVFRRIYVSNKYEVLQIITTFFIPIIFLWVPLLPQIDQVKYGPDGLICDIQILNCSNYEQIPAGRITKSIIHSLPVLLFLITFVSLYIITIIKLRNQCNQYEGIYDPSHRKEAEDLIKKVRILMLFPIIYLLFFIPEVVRNFVFFWFKEQMYIALSAICIVVANFRGIFVSVAFVLEPGICSRLKANMKGVFERDSSFNSYANSYRNVSYTDSLVQHQRIQSSTYQRISEEN